MQKDTFNSLVEKRADNYAIHEWIKPGFGPASAFAAGATDPLIVRAIELRERISFGKKMRIYVDARIMLDFDREIEQAEAELAQLMAGIEEKA